MISGSNDAPGFTVPKFELAIAPHSPFGAGQRQVAVRHVVAVRVAPRPRRGGDDAVHRVEHRGDPGRREALQVPVQRDLDRGSAVAEQIVSRAHPRRDVLERRAVLRGKRDVAAGVNTVGPRCCSGELLLNQSKRRPGFPSAAAPSICPGRRRPCRDRRWSSSRTDTPPA